MVGKRTSAPSRRSSETAGGVPGGRSRILVRSRPPAPAQKYRDRSRRRPVRQAANGPPWWFRRCATRLGEFRSWVPLGSGRGRESRSLRRETVGAHQEREQIDEKNTEE